MSLSKRSELLEKQLEYEKRNALHPHFTTRKVGFMCWVVEWVDHPFLQALVDEGAAMYYDDGFHVFGGESAAYLQIFHNCVWLECIATPVEHRRKGHASHLMDAFCQLADRTSTIIKLETAMVDGAKRFGGHGCPAIALGTQTKHKIPVKGLRGWYEKFGFVSLGKTWGGFLMERSPNHN